MSFDDFDFDFNPMEDDFDEYMAKQGMDANIEEEREPTPEELEAIEREQAAVANAQYHFLPQHHDCPDLSLELEERITVPLMRVKAVMHHSTTHLPFERMVCSWHWTNERGPYPREAFDKQLKGALDAMAEFINGRDKLLAYPMTNKPDVTTGVAYHDYGGPTAPLDVRLVIRYDSIPEAQGKHGLSFHLITLAGTEHGETTGGEAS